MNERTIVAFASLLLLVGCGGGGGSSTTPVVDGAPGSACSNDYYRQLIGTYEGQITRASAQDDGSILARCEWSTEVVIRPKSSGRSCELVADTTAEVTQLVVLPADDPSAFQCFSDKSSRELDDPNDDLETLAEFADVTFPVLIDPEKNLQVSGSGPYFEDQSASVFYVWLLDGTASAFDFWEIDDDGTLTFVNQSPADTSRDTAILQKVAP